MVRKADRCIHVVSDLRAYMRSKPEAKLISKSVAACVRVQATININ